MAKAICAVHLAAERRRNLERGLTQVLSLQRYSGWLDQASIP